MLKLSDNDCGTLWLAQQCSKSSRCRTRYDILALGAVQLLEQDKDVNKQAATDRAADSNHGFGTVSESTIVGTFTQPLKPDVAMHDDDSNDGFVPAPVAQNSLRTSAKLQQLHLRPALQLQSMMQNSWRRWLDLARRLERNA